MSSPFAVCRGLQDSPDPRWLPIANVAHMFACMGTLDRCIRDLIPAHPKRSGPSGRRFGVEVLGNPGSVASLKHGRGTRVPRGEASREQGSWLPRSSMCLPVFLLCQWTNPRIASSSIPEPWTCRSNAPRLSRAEEAPAWARRTTTSGRGAGGGVSGIEPVHPGALPGEGWRATLCLLLQLHARPAERPRRAHRAGRAPRRRRIGGRMRPRRARNGHRRK